jgi:ATP-dependent Clp protease ATP-binding subunit ClpX
MSELFKNLSPSSIYKELDKRVVGQDAAKRALSSALFVHVMKLHQKEYGFKSNVMFIGSSGCGKTHMMNQIEHIFPELKLIKIDASAISKTGYVGSSIIDLLHAQIEDQKEADNAVVFIDEIDKMCETDKDKEWKSDLQASLLKLVEGGECVIKEKSSSYSSSKSFNTNKTLFVFSGNFATIRDKRKEAAENKRRSTIGFAESNDKEKREQSIQEQLIEAGMKAELVGRISHIAELEKLTKKQLTDILLRPGGYLDDLNKSIFAQEKDYIKISTKQLESIIDTAYEAETGARVLNTLLLNTINEMLFEVPGRDLDYLIAKNVEEAKLEEAYKKQAEEFSFRKELERRGLPRELLGVGELLKQHTFKPEDLLDELADITYKILGKDPSEIVTEDINHLNVVSILCLLVIKRGGHF